MEFSFFTKSPYVDSQKTGSHQRLERSSRARLRCRSRMQFLKNRSSPIFGFLALSHSHHASQRHESDLLALVSCASANYESAAKHTRARQSTLKAFGILVFTALSCDLPGLAALCHHLGAWCTGDRVRQADLAHGLLPSATNRKATIAH